MDEFQGFWPSDPTALSLVIAVPELLRVVVVVIVLILELAIKPLP